jgi:hypothetical protein
MLALPHPPPSPNTLKTLPFQDGEKGSLPTEQELRGQKAGLDILEKNNSPAFFLESNDVTSAL